MQVYTQEWRIAFRVYSREAGREAEQEGQLVHVLVVTVSDVSQHVAHAFPSTYLKFIPNGKFP